MKELVEYLKKNGMNVTYDNNPSKEKVDYINKRVKLYREKFDNKKVEKVFDELIKKNGNPLEDEKWVIHPKQ